MTPADGMDLARQVHTRAEAHGVEAWCAAVDVLNSGDEADQQRARELMVFVRHHQQVREWLGALPTPAQLAPNDQRAPTGLTTRPVWWQTVEGALGVLALFAALWISLAVLT